jgi:hypothetical protein
MHVQIDFAMRNVTSTNTPTTANHTDGPLDREMSNPSAFDDVNQHNISFCGCDEPGQCMAIFRRCVIDGKMFHSLIYTRRGSTISYFVRYRHHLNDNLFGKIRFFFSMNQETFALIENHPLQAKFSEFVSHSTYYQLLSKSIDSFYFVLSNESSSMHCVPVNCIENHCIVFERLDCILVTPLSICHEHD